ncbi:hypothetical protein [Arthrobacter sp. TB 26]|uniref:hypothetical protein n=1 Tax=Arthrobacter sp. TB 26 TaxID=494420 RepID=UPI00040C86D7|nr:hypothetical protein [Arthrobacter sp. TB 26]
MVPGDVVHTRVGDIVPALWAVLMAPVPGALLLLILAATASGGFIADRLKYPRSGS